jgi:uroporphyrinogen decarboxylase
MNSIERFFATVNRQPVDRPAAWLGMPTPDALPGLFAYYGVGSLHALKLAVGDDFYAVEVPYQSETASAIYAAFDWYRNGSDVDAEHRTLTTQGCFADAEELEDLDFFDWPDPSKYIDPEECTRRIDLAPKDKVALGMLWCCHFQDFCASFGMETALMNMAANPELIEAVDSHIMDFYLKACRIFFEATRGKLHAVLIGDDLGSQQALMISPDLVRKYVLPGAKKLVDLAHSYNLKVIYHSCGAISDIIEDLIGIGVDIVHPIQAKAKGMDASELKKRFGGRVSFCGGVDTQELLPNGTPDQVRAAVRNLKTLFPTGLIISPSHEAIQSDVPPENIHALFEETAKTE